MPRGKEQNEHMRGLKNFYFVGQWATAAEAGLPNALSGKAVVKEICRKCGQKFKESDQTKERFTSAKD